MTENKVISKILIDKVIPDDLEPSLFDAHKEIFSFIFNFYYEHKKTPDMETIKCCFPDFELENVPEPMSYYLFEFNKQRNTIILNKALLDTAEILDKLDISAAENILTTAMRRINIKQLSDLSVDSMVQMEYYKNCMANRHPSGYQTKYETFNTLVGGFKPQELHIIAGRAKVGKTFFMLNLAHDFYMNGANIVFISKEMPPHILQERFDSIHTCIPYGSIKRKTITTEQMDLLYQSKTEFAGFKNKFIFLANDTIEKTGTINGVINKIFKHTPDILFVDSFYLFDDGNRNSDVWVKVGNIAIDLAELGRKNNICVFGSTQLNRNVSTKENNISYKSMGYSDTIIQVCDSMTALYQNPILKVNSVLNVAVIADRSGDTGDFDISWDFDTMNFSEVNKEDYNDEEVVPFGSK